MLPHYLKIAFRNLRKYKTQSLTGIFGLAFAIACFVPALYWMRYETTYDGFYPDAAHIYRFYFVEKQTGKINDEVPDILERKLHEHFPATETSTRYSNYTVDYSTDETPFIRMNTICTDNTFFRVFPQLIISGDARAPLQIDGNMVITETVAVRLFGDIEKAIGQQIKMPSPFVPPFRVTAVIEDPPPNTNLPFDAILFWESVHKGYPNRPEATQWLIFEKIMYAKFHPHTNVNELAEQMRDFTSRLDVNHNIDLRMMPISDVRHRLNTDLPFTLNFIRLFVAAGILLMFSALFNFLNFHLDFFNQRISELRQRTVVGAKGRQHIVQMMFELTCTILLTLALSCFFIVLARPAILNLLDIEMKISQLIYLFAVCGISVMALMLVVGFIPFWRLSRMAMRNLAKGKSTRQPLMRRMAVSLQLSVSFVFIVAALVVMMQMRFISHKDLGFNHNGIIQLSGLNFTTKETVLTALMNELAAIPQIENITETYFEPQHNLSAIMKQTNVEWTGKTSNENPTIQIVSVDSRFAETYRLNMIQGRWWNDNEKQKIVLNEEAVRLMGLSEPVGAVIRVPDEIVSYAVNTPLQDVEVVGVVNDFHSLSLRSRIYPTIFTNESGLYPFLYIRAFSGQEQEAIRRIKATLPCIDASLADVRLTPLDELYDRLNHSEQVGLKMFSVMATVCLLISLFGIYAVATASTQRRRKEIAIRKVFGASVWEIIRMFFREYTLQVIIAGVVALPLAYLAMSRWLQGYAFRTNIPSWLLIGVVISVVAVVLLIVFGQVLKAANRNPADEVKSE